MTLFQIIASLAAAFFLGLIAAGSSRDPGQSGVLGAIGLGVLLIILVTRFLSL